MHKIRYRIRTLSPILLSTQSGDMNMTATLDYIPGSALLGVFAGKYIQAKNLGDNAHENPDFYNWFLNSRVIFCNAYPCKETEHRTENYLPVPLSIQTKKNDETSADDLLKKPSDPKKQIKTINGYCDIAGDTIQKLAPSKSLNFHHARPDRIKGHSGVEGQIFNYESIDPDQLFEGEIIGDEKTLQEFVGLVDNKFPIRLGRSKTAQYGRAELEILSGAPEELEVKDHLDDEIYLTFLSSVILYNENGFPNTSLADFKRYLAKALEIDSDRIQVDGVFKKPVEIENFISTWRLKRPSEAAFQAGSCFSIKITGWNDSIESKLIELQKEGIGERRGEGFGRIILNWQMKDSYTVKESKEKKRDTEKPDGKKPALTAKIFKDVIKENWRKMIEGKALKEYKEFSKNENNSPTNALLGRLEMMLKSAAGDMEQFLGKMLKLRKTAREKLEACRGKDKGKDVTLLDFIEDGNPDFQQAFNQESALGKMGENIEYNPSTDTIFCNELYQLYWLTFFRMIRKSKKEGANE
ncbi:MAG: hypothetical protein AAB110_06425 [Candidatus Desantisbacteria bacterium]